MSPESYTSVLVRLRTQREVDWNRLKLDVDKSVIVYERSSRVASERQFYIFLTDRPYKRRSAHGNVRILAYPGLIYLRKCSALRSLVL